MCKCVREWVRDDSLSLGETHALVPISCEEYITELENMLARLVYRRAELDADNFDLEREEKRLLDLKERVVHS